MWLLMFSKENGHLGSSFAHHQAQPRNALYVGNTHPIKMEVVILVTSLGIPKKSWSMMLRILVMARHSIFDETGNKNDLMYKQNTVTFLEKKQKCSSRIWRNAHNIFPDSTKKKMCVPFFQKKTTEKSHPPLNPLNQSHLQKTSDRVIPVNKSFFQKKGVCFRLKKKTSLKKRGLKNN